MSYIELKLLLVLNDFLIDKSGINTPVRNKKPQPHSSESLQKPSGNLVSG